MVLLTPKCDPQLTLPFWHNSCFHCHHYQYHCRCFTVSKKHILGLQNHRWSGAVWEECSLYQELIWHLVTWMYRWLSGKEFICQCGRHRRRGLDPWVRKIPWRRKWQPTPGFLPEKFHRGAWWTIVHVESNMTEHTLYMFHGSAFHDSQKKHSSWFGFAAPFSLAFRKKPMKSDTKRLWRRIWAAFSAFNPSSAQAPSIRASLPSSRLTHCSLEFHHQLSQRSGSHSNFCCITR